MPRTIGAEIVEGGVAFRVWAPERRTVEVVRLDGAERPIVEPLGREDDGYFAVTTDRFAAGDLYAFRLDGDDRLLADPASRFQPGGVHGPSQVLHLAHAWRDDAWRGPAARGLVVYELHLGTFTPEGTYAAAARRLPALAELGVTVVELMPLADFPGAFGWGYDGVLAWAPTATYGTPDALCAFVDAAHALGIAVILDVVYNHVGPAGNPLPAFSRHYLSDQAGEWGDCFAFHGAESRPVRDYFVGSAVYWIERFHLDGFRFDAVHAIADPSPTHLVAELVARARAAAPHRRLWMVGEDNPQRSWITRPLADGGYDLDALWSDDFHHSAVVAATGRNEAYYGDFAGTPQELISVARWGLLFQGQYSTWEGKPRGTSNLDLDAHRCVTFLENHDQVANGGLGSRLVERVAPARWRALTAFWLLAPGTPMFFQGQEYGSRAPFTYFADHEPELAVLVARGRRVFMAQFPSLGTDAVAGAIPDPADPVAFARCKLDHDARDPRLWVLHRDLLRLRRDDPAFAAQRADRLFGAVLGPQAFVLRHRCAPGDRLVLVNLGADHRFAVNPEPLLAPPPGRRWRLAWSSEAVVYGGSGTPPLGADVLGWTLPGGCTAVLLGDEEETR